MKKSPAKEKRTCRLKRRHQTKEDADAFIQSYYKGSEKFYSYQCDVCGHWHIATGYPDMSTKRHIQKRLKQMAINMREKRKRKLKVGGRRK